MAGLALRCGEFHGLAGDDFVGEGGEVEQDLMPVCGRQGVNAKAKRDSSTAPANFFVGTKKEEKFGRLRSE
jgi:hypothetical protein